MINWKKKLVEKLEKQLAKKDKHTFKIIKKMCIASLLNIKKNTHTNASYYYHFLNQYFLKS